MQLGSFLRQFTNGAEKDAHHPLNAAFYEDFSALIAAARVYNPWFTEQNVRQAAGAIGESLQEEKLVEWLSHYIARLNTEKPVRVAVIMAGNIPMVGFHDMMCVLLSGNSFLGKLSSDDKLLLPFLSKLLIAAAPEFEGRIAFTEDRLTDFQAVIATGSNNSARYFDYYFGKYPHIIRKNRNSVCVLSGDENEGQLTLLGEDIFQYFGLGCRNVSKLFVPEGYDFDRLYKSLIGFADVITNNKYANNYEYNRTVLLMGSDPTLLDNNFLLLKYDEGYSSPVGVLYFEFYDDLNALNERLKKEQEQIQCIVSACEEIDNVLPFGTAQCPALGDYADGVDTMEFLINL